MSAEQQHPLASKILKLREKKSYGLIGKELGVSRNVVAGVMFRARHRGKKLMSSPNSTGSGNKTGVGRHGPGKYARKTLVLPGWKVGRRWKCKPRKSADAGAST
jgi:hypothetical protein